MRERKPAESASGAMGRRVHSVAESARNTSSAPSAAKPTRAACTSIAPPRGTLTLPGSTFTSRLGTAASAVPNGTNRRRALVRSDSGPNTSATTAMSESRPSEPPARCMRGRSSAIRSCSGRIAPVARCMRRAASGADMRSASGVWASCTAEMSACLSSGARSSTYSANRSSLARRRSGSTRQRTIDAAMSV